MIGATGWDFAAEERRAAQDMVAAAKLAACKASST